MYTKMQKKTKYSRPAIRTVDVRPRHTLLAGSPVSPSRSLDVDDANLNNYGNGGEETLQDN